MSVRTAIEAAGLTDGATLSFHHHLRNGDDVMREALQTCADMGLRDLHIAPSSLFPCHAALIPFLEDDTVTRITTSYMNGPLAEAVQRGLLPHPVRLQSHGGRAEAIASGRLQIDAAFIATPAVDTERNLGGAAGPNACGPLGYAMVDAAHARFVTAVTDHYVYDLPRVCIPADRVDLVVTVDSIGDAQQVASGTTARAPSAKGQAIADLTARLIACSGLLKDGFSFQTGAGATSLAVARSLAPVMAERGVVGDFAAGGITGPLVQMLHSGLFRHLLDVQAFDGAAVTSYSNDTAHHGMSAWDYASPANPDSAASRLDVMILGAAEVDMDFNVNVTCASDGRIIGGSGGHADTAAGAKLAIVTTPLCAGGFPKLVERLTCLTTPGDTIGAVVTEEGIAISPTAPELARAAKIAGLPLSSLDDLRRKAEAQATQHATARFTDRVIAECEAPDGTVIDHVRALAP
ncbi:citrate lyase subunit alpha [Roseovarius atlanticus]|uniref:citrate lyase subunit alpha n=1 Tax=Roseovarius atlanticus TaxID=1641875 RepID=UPI000709E0FA|nr:citrate lyase subunit alpha [Roseovarius atlanticus]